MLQSRQPTLTRRSRAQCPLVRPEVIAPLSFSFVPNHSREMCSFINVPPRAPTKPNMRKPGGSLYYSSTNRTMDLPAALACDIDVVVKVLPFIHVMTQRSPRVPPGVPAAGVEGVDHHGLIAHGEHQTGHRARELEDKVARCHAHDDTFSHQHMRIHNVGDWALGRAGGRRRGPPASHRAVRWHRA